MKPLHGCACAKPPSERHDAWLRMRSTAPARRPARIALQARAVAHHRELPAFDARVAFVALQSRDADLFGGGSFRGGAAGAVGCAAPYRRVRAVAVFFERREVSGARDREGG